jgi:hypothetical protein
MNNQQRAQMYDDLLRENDFLARKISKLKSEYAPNIPAHVQVEINESERKIANLVLKLENLFR